MFGSSSFLDRFLHSSFDAPVIASHETKDKGRIRQSQFEWRNYRHHLNGGCSNIRVKIGFFGLKAPKNLPPMLRSLGHF